MSIARRDFIRLFGIGLASFLVSRCQAVLPPALSARDELRRLWLRFGELAQKTQAGRNDEDELGTSMIAEHRAALDAMVADGALSPEASELVQEAYAAAVYHVWRSNAPITCYAPMMVDYAPTGAATLVKQSETLAELSNQGNVDPTTLANAQTALEHDLAFYELTDDETQALYQAVLQKNQGGGQPIPSFDALELELTPEAREAARFILDLLSSK